ncbi:hypothetical protein GLOTRDRAFT_127302 [Gloeophyllum trabeum ATCC 11539]|uniref:Uncharacterized protein n=1 Tax=Gloeophyllum trabeum (strain ATCC 11539 / FP-39264 / Madison 617) TaxID=670483 RepID=S7RQR3_GLOTA|nr:uncharacterized protein GLOTRDRAFT_127302 [Gloeophyllum trabeum ATCC 11539]XP_007871613.1 uncharacterized protein GLOTRDRAFT_134443 [Gloeophyllum trabeum ATCC 11539]EPQ49930.1 hypothetical protein GLOTRDRAFT_134443 [Gloeophyllum trabeum ATCC 11539]EPQ56915.1 hypothetical protein GLOTRDRAFT_127302 [Gloeophyllum trabeum ATCC 11539]
MSTGTTPPQTPPHTPPQRDPLEFFGHTVGHTALPYDRQDEFNAVESALPPQSTPVKKGGNPEGNSELKVEDTKIMADEELRGYCAPNISGLLELIFPDIALPCPLDALYRHVSKRGGKYKSPSTEIRRQRWRIS